jgi:hypothetical protein
VVVVGGWFEVEPGEREAFIAGRLAGMRASREHPGCQEYTFAADPLVPGRVVLYERWDDQAALDNHLKLLRENPPTPDADAPAPVTPTASEIVLYEVSDSRKLG